MAVGGLVAGMLGAQTASPAFEAVEIRVTGQGVKKYGGFESGIGMDWHTFTMVELIRQAYATQSVFGGPAWLNQHEFDIRARAPRTSVAADWQPMLRALLADRFALAAHRGEWPVDAWVLAVGKQSAIRAATGGAPGCKRSAGDGQVGLTCRNVSMPALADELSGAGSGYFDAPVADGTGLKGAYDVSLNWTPRALLGSERAGVSLFDALREAGLTVARGKAADRGGDCGSRQSKAYAEYSRRCGRAASAAYGVRRGGTEAERTRIHAGKRNAVRNGHTELYRTTLAGVDRHILPGR